MENDRQTSTKHMAQEQREENLEVKRIRKVLKAQKLVNELDCGRQFNSDPSDKALEVHEVLDDLKHLSAKNGGDL